MRGACRASPGRWRTVRPTRIEPAPAAARAQPARPQLAEAEERRLEGDARAGSRAATRCSGAGRPGISIGQDQARDVAVGDPEEVIVRGQAPRPAPGCSRGRAPRAGRRSSGRDGRRPERPSSARRSASNGPPNSIDSKVQSWVVVVLPGRRGQARLAADVAEERLGVPAVLDRRRSAGAGPGGLAALDPQPVAADLDGVDPVAPRAATGVEAVEQVDVAGRGRAAPSARSAAGDGPPSPCGRPLVGGPRSARRGSPSEPAAGPEVAPPLQGDVGARRPATSAAPASVGSASRGAGRGSRPPRTRRPPRGSPPSVRRVRPGAGRGGRGPRRRTRGAHGGPRFHRVAGWIVSTTGARRRNRGDLDRERASGPRSPAARRTGRRPRRRSGRSGPLAGGSAPSSYQSRSITVSPQWGQ